MFRGERSSEYETITNSNNCQEILNESQDETICKISGYIENKTYTVIYHIFGILFLGVPYIIFKIYPKFETIKFKSCSLDRATILLACDNHGQISFIIVKNEWMALPPSETLVDMRYFVYQHTKYVWISEIQQFGTLDVLIPSLTVDEYLTNLNGLQEVEYLNRLQLYGQNKIEVEIKSYWRLFVEEVFNPFYMFQAFSVILWLFDDYISYALCVVALTLFSSITSLIQTRKQSQALHDLVESSKCLEVKVLRCYINSRNITELINPVNLVPGDLIVLPSVNFIMPCDAVLLTGQCIVNESVLTGKLGFKSDVIVEHNFFYMPVSRGLKRDLLVESQRESIPITKTSLHPGPELYHVNTHKRNTLFSGTHILQTRYYEGELILARVTRTGFDTTKGALVKSILFPAPVGLKFYRDSFKFVLFLFMVAAVGMCYCLYLYIARHAHVKEIILRTLDIITIVVPPALPAAIAVGTVYSQNRLKKIGIYCISPPRINICGKIKLACFDKTGTLTHEGLDMKCVISCIDGQFSDEITNINEITIDSPFVQAMATCHSLTRIDGELKGDPLDLNMFEFTQWELEEPGGCENSRYDVLAPIVVKPHCKQYKKNYKDNSYLIGILRQFPFSSTFQCMSVICRNIKNPNMVAFTKGAPEKIHGMCLPETVPVNFGARLTYYTSRGYRVIAVAYKELPKKSKWKEVQKCKRDVIECDLRFLGLMIMQNSLKTETAPVIQSLHKAAIRTVMITGDNILTAISVSRDCGMVKSNEKIFIINVENCDNPNAFPIFNLRLAGASPSEDVVVDIDSNPYHLAIDGRTWNTVRNFCPHLMPHLLVRTTVFARFQPDQKTQVITSLQGLDYVVSMVGDGANDCGALKAAHVGVSLSQAEASVAAPFTSSIENISCLIHLMLEGRCAIVTSFAIFKYMAMYSLIQFFTVLLLYRHHSLLGDHQFLFIDLVITTSLAVTIGRQGPANVLGATRPMSSLVAAKNVIPLVLQILTCALIQGAALYYLFQQDWFKPIPNDTVGEVILSWENTVLFTVSCYQYIILGTVYSKGRPYRQMLITNFWFLFCALALTTFVTILMIEPNKVLAELMDIMYLPHRAREQNNFRFSLVAFPVFHLMLAVFIEVGIADRQWLKKVIQCLTCKRYPKNQYKSLLQQNNEEFLSHIDNSRTIS